MNTPLMDLDAQVASIDADERTGALDLPRITSQQKMFVAALVGGLPVRGASEQAGCSYNTGLQWAKDEVIVAYREKYEAEMECSLKRVKFGVEDAHAMYMQAYHMSGTSAEMTKATDSLVKLHRLNEAPVVEVPKSVTARQLADLPVAELLRLAGLKVDQLAPGAIDGEFEEVHP